MVVGIGNALTNEKALQYYCRALALLLRNPGLRLRSPFGKAHPSTKLRMTPFDEAQGDTVLNHKLFYSIHPSTKLRMTLFDDTQDDTT